MDLELATSDDLITELLSRYEQGVIVLMRDDNGDDRQNASASIRRRWVGDDHANVGLLADVQLTILDDMRERTIQE